MKADTQGTPTEQKRAAVGWLKAAPRPACARCKQCETRIAERMPPYDTKSWHCKAHGFATQATAVCDHFQPTNR